MLLEQLQSSTLVSATRAETVFRFEQVSYSGVASGFDCDTLDQSTVVP